MDEYTGFAEIDEAAKKYVNWADDLTGREKHVEVINEESKWVAFAMLEKLGRGRYVVGYDTTSFIEGIVEHALGDGFLPELELARFKGNVLDDFCRISRKDSWRGGKKLNFKGELDYI